MKITIDIDCSPREARTFLGLPDVEAMQTALLRELQQRMGDHLAAMDPEALMQTWLPAGMQGLEQIQKAFWAQFSGGQSGGGDKDKS